MSGTITFDINELRQWIGKRESCTDRITPTPMAALSATLDRDDEFPKSGDPVPPLWSWLYFLPLPRQSELGPEGHVRRGGFLPPVPLPQRMWAGGRFEFLRPLRVGETATRTSEIRDVRHKQGRSGNLIFVVVRHEISAADGLILTEEHDIVYREHQGPPPGTTGLSKAQEAPDWIQRIEPDDMLLFRYSALTFNTHRIHYDRRYATTAEGFPGLVVHGPLIATLLLDLLRRKMPTAKVSRFDFRAIAPLFDTAAFLVQGRLDESEQSVRLWASDEQGNRAVEAAAELAKRE